MHGSKQDLPVVVDFKGVVIRSADWGEMNVSFDFFPAGTDSEPVFKGLPDDRCQCPHWGVVLKGRVRIRFADREEIIEAGEAYYMEPGHVCFYEEDTESIGFSPVHELEKSNEIMARNLAVMQVAGS